ncbi:MAG: glucose-6-phosphate isomerase [Candidatus Aegiribacteria sp.]|nr:glucose-6-phosphate isomerase [Candidatus Aegiribacteria sp.]
MTTGKPLLDYRTSFDFDPLPENVFKRFNKWIEDGKLGFMELPEDTALFHDTLELAHEIEKSSDRMIVCGIGGSSLGLRALLRALEKYQSGVSVVDSPDSRMLEDLISRFNPDSTALAVITKSGGTAETMAIFLTLYRWLRESSDADSRVIAITDPDKGDLRKLARDRAWNSLPVPTSVGGRFSVLSPVGLFPAAFAGIDIKSLLRGALVITEDYFENGSESVAARIAAGYLHNFKSHPVHVFFPYDDRLHDTALWFAQLWAESLGKRTDLSGNEVYTGQTPLACRGPADQHSLVQLFTEGPRDKTVTVLTAPGDSGAAQIPGGFNDYPSIAYLEGRTPDELRLAEAEATGKALEEVGIPVSYLAMRSLDEHSLGGLLMSLEIATVLTGLALNINPLDQPGVERCKVLIYKAMNRPGYHI